MTTAFGTSAERLRAAPRPEPNTLAVWREFEAVGVLDGNGECRSSFLVATSITVTVLSCALAAQIPCH